MIPEMIFTEDYTGPRWTYGMTHRPPAIGCQPDGRIIGADRRDDPRALFGTIQYARELTVKEIEGYELLPLGRSEDGSTRE
jgi:defence-against-restriction DarA-like protein